MRLFADSGCDLPLAFLQDYNVTLFPLVVELNGETYRDMLDLRAEEVYDAIREGATPRTHQTPSNVLYEAFHELAMSEEDGVYITFSSNLSGMYEEAVNIKQQLIQQYPGFQLEIIDSQCASLGYGLLVDKAARMNEEGYSTCEIVKEVKRRMESMVQLLVVDDLRYLAKGGRLSKAGAFVGELLSINPIFEMKNGKLLEIERVRGRQKAMQRMLDLLETRCTNLSNQVICISHADDVTFAAELKKVVETRFRPRKVGIAMIGSSIGCHTGPDAIALFALDESYYTHIEHHL